MTQLTDSERTTYEDGAWYWVEKEGWIGDPPTIAPALYKAQSDAWYSFAFSGIPTREVKVLEPCRRAPAVPTRKQIEQYLYEQGAVTVSRDVAEAAGLARLAGNMQSAPAVPVPQGLREAAQAVVERWDTPLWKDVPATAVYIADLRAALSAAPQPPDAFQTEGGCPVSNAETVAIAALEKVLRAVQRHLPPERIGERETIAEIISIVDPWPLGKPPEPWKDHMTAELVGKLTDVARQFHGTQQLRERIAGLVRPVCERIKQLDGDRMPEGDMGNPISASAPAQLPEIDIDTANHAGIRVRGYTQETVRQLLADQQFKLDELAMLTRMVVHAFRKVAPDNKTAAKAVDYLKRKGLQGNPLRSLGIQEQST